MESVIRILLKCCHASVFLVSMIIWWRFPSTMYDDAMYMTAICTYVTVANFSRREILPAMVILLAAYLVNWFVTYQLYDRNLLKLVGLYGFGVVFNLLLSFCLYKYHCHVRVQQFFGVQFRRQFIPQVIGICIILSFSSISIMCVLAELTAYSIVPQWFSQTRPPFFYGIYKYTSAVFSCLMMLGVWSMMLDAHFLKARLDHKKNSAQF